jgi:hypothetical protein
MPNLEGFAGNGGPEKTTSGPGAGRWAKILVLALSITLSAAVLEIVSQHYYGIHFGSPLSPDQVRERMDAVKSSAGDAGMEPSSKRIMRYSTHPYLGYVDFNPPNNRYGFFGEEPVVKKADDTVTVGVMGGSVALLCYRESGGTLERRLQRSFPTKRIKTYGLALAAYKQPQQLMELTYLLSLGAEYDYIINIDGYNEIGSAMLNNADLFNISLAYPSYWPLFTIDWHTGEAMNEYKNLEGRRRSLASAFSREPLRSSSFMLTLWSICNERLEGDMMRKVSEINMAGNLTRDPEATGPMTVYGGVNETLEGLVGVWSRSTVQMDKLCRANNITYVGMIQPNQYLAGSKRLSEEEGWKAFNAISPWYPSIRDGYPMLLREADRLAKAGVRVYNATMIFRDVNSTIYTDNCCHFNKEGCDLLMEEAARHIAEASGQEGEAAPA